MIKAKGKTGGRETFLIYLLVISLLLAGGWKIAGAALYSDIKSLRDEIAIIEDESARLRELLDSEDFVIAAWEQWHNDSDRLHNLIPDHSELDVVLGNVEKIPGTVKAAVQSFTVDNLNSYESYSTARVILAVSCCPATALALLSELDAISHLFSMESITWRVNEEGNVRLDLAFRLYFFNQASAAGE
jgi:hypothetical protein